MKKYFITADIHSFYTEFMDALKDAGFDINNEEHILLICGDIFDRGNESVKMYEFIRSLPKNRRILIRGNHELLFIDLKSKNAPQYHDFSNGTVKTFYHLTNSKNDEDFYIVKNKPIIDEVIDWFNSDEWIYYYETKRYIFVHAFIPVSGFYYRMYDANPNMLIFREDWRNATKYEFEDATWGSPWQMAKVGLNKTGKMIVCGHWHTSDFFNNLRPRGKHYNINEENPIFKSKIYGIIGLDACTALTHKVNILVLNEDEL